MKKEPPVRIGTVSATPVRCAHYRRQPLTHRYIEEQVEDMRANGMVEESISNWSFPVVLASKPNGKIQFCIEYR